MKKLAALILSLILALGSVAIAEDYTWQNFADSLDDQTLQAVAAFLQSEAIRRLGYGYDLPAGIYVVGDNIPSGAFTVTGISQTTAEFIIFADEEHFSEDLFFFDELLSEDYDSNTIGRIYLAPMNIVQVSGKVHLAPFTGLQP